MTAVPELAERARTLCTPGMVTILGIAGPPGAGKSTLATALLDDLAATLTDPESNQVTYVPLDGFHLADIELERLGIRDRKGAPETFDAAGYANALQRIKRAHDTVVYVPSFERTLEQPLAGAIPVPASTMLVVTEGNYLLLDDGPWAAVRTFIDEVWYVDADQNQRVERLIDRHIHYGKSPEQARAWVMSSDEQNAQRVAATRHKSDLVITPD